jgi:hypothetical protein
MAQHNHLMRLAPGFETSVHGLPISNQDPNNTKSTRPDALSKIAPRGLAAKALADRSNTHVAAILTRFTNLVQLCMAPEDDAATLETQASRSLQIEVGWQGLVRLCWDYIWIRAENGSQVKEAEDLLKLTRELKELWLAGPLRDIGEGEGDGDMVENAKKVQELLDGITKKAREMGVDTDGKVHWWDILEFGWISSI